MNELQKETVVIKQLIVFIGLCFLVFLLWAYAAKIDEITIATGKIVPPSQIQIIQSLEGGIIEDILVKEGQHIQSNQILLRIDDTSASASFREREKKVMALTAQIARLKAEMNSQTSIAFPATMNNHPDIKLREMKLFEKRQQSLKNTVGTLRKNLALAKNELKITEPLVKEGVMSEIELLRLQRQVNEIRGELSEKEDSFKEETQKELTDAQSEWEQLTESIESQKERVKRTVIRSPVTGIIKKIHFATIGGVIKPGEDIMEIVPLEKQLEIEAKVRPSDIAFIHPGQKAMIKFSAYDFTTYGGMEAHVTYIGADTITEDEQTFYEVNLRTEQNYLGKKEKPLPIIPGMTITAHIKTGQKTILDYILKPLRRAQERALRER